MLTISEAQRRTELFLTGQMLEALGGVTILRGILSYLRQQQAP